MQHRYFLNPFKEFLGIKYYIPKIFNKYFIYYIIFLEATYHAVGCLKQSNQQNPTFLQQNAKLQKTNVKNKTHNVVVSNIILPTTVNKYNRYKNIKNSTKTKKNLLYNYFTALTTTTKNS